MDLENARAGHTIVPLPLFDGFAVPRDDRIRDFIPDRIRMTALDEAERAVSRFTAVLATWGFKRAWQARSDNRSPAWTTRIDKIPVLSARL